MTMKKSLIAIAVSSAFVAPMAAQADAGAYGRINIGALYTNDDAAGTRDEGIGMQSVSSRFGFQGDEDLGNGLSVLYKYEFAVNARTATINAGNRLSYVGLEGDFGQVTAGRVWSAWYDYLGWNVDRSQFWGGTGYYDYSGAGLNLGGVGAVTRVSDTVKYTYGGGGYSSDPFTFTLEAVMDADSAGGRADGANIPGSGQADPQTFDVLTAAGQGTFGMFTVNAAYRTAQSNDTGVNAEPSQFGLGGRVDLGPAFVGVTFSQDDPDVSGAPEPTLFEILGTYDFGQGLSAQLSVSQVDADTNSGVNDATGVFAQVNKALSSRTNVYVEGNRVDIDGGTGSDTSPTQILVGIGHSF